MKSLYVYFKLLFSDDEQLMRKWNQVSDGKVSEKYRQAVAKELQKREYRYDVLTGLNLPLEVEGDAVIFFINPEKDSGEGCLRYPSIKTCIRA